MRLKLLNEYIDENVLFGPLPNFNDSFESFFISKAFQSLFETSANESGSTKQIVGSSYLFLFSDLKLLFF
jgi:hypothetical protein